MEVRRVSGEIEARHYADNHEWICSLKEDTGGFMKIHKDIIEDADGSLTMTLTGSNREFAWNCRKSGSLVDTEFIPTHGGQISTIPFGAIEVWIDGIHEASDFDWRPASLVTCRGLYSGFNPHEPGEKLAVISVNHRIEVGVIASEATVQALLDIEFQNGYCWMIPPRFVDRYFINGTEYDVSAADNSRINVSGWDGETQIVAYHSGNDLRQYGVAGEVLIPEVTSRLGLPGRREPWFWIHARVDNTKKGYGESFETGSLMEAGTSLAMGGRWSSGVANPILRQMKSI